MKCCVSHIWDLKRFWYQVVCLVPQIWGKNDSKRKSPLISIF